MLLIAFPSLHLFSGLYPGGNCTHKKSALCSLLTALAPGNRSYQKLLVLPYRDILGGCLKDDDYSIHHISHAQFKLCLLILQIQSMPDSGQVAWPRTESGICLGRSHQNIYNFSYGYSASFMSGSTSKNTENEAQDRLTPNAARMRQEIILNHYVKNNSEKISCHRI